MNNAPHSGLRILFRSLLIVAAISAMSACATQLAQPGEGDESVFDVSASSGRGGYEWIFLAFLATFVISGAVFAANAGALGTSKTGAFILGVGACAGFWAFMCS